MSYSSHQGSSAGKWNSKGEFGLMSMREGMELTRGGFMLVVVTGEEILIIFMEISRLV